MVTLLLVAILSVKYGNTFEQDFYSNWFATLLGLYVGIPMGLWASGHQEKKTEKEKRKKVLQLLKGELTHNEAIILVYLYPPGETVPDDNENSQLSLFLQVEVWKAFADGGELQWIKDPEILEKLSIAYFQIGVIKKLSERFFEMTYRRGQLGRHEFINEVLNEIHTGADEFLKTMRSLDNIFFAELR